MECLADHRQYRPLAHEVLKETVIKFLGHYIVTAVLAAAVCAAAYGLLGQYARYHVQRQLHEAQRVKLGLLKEKQQELRRKSEILAQVGAFSEQVRNLGLEQGQWSFYDVNVQGGFSFENTGQIVGQCANSDLAYYWPIALEIRTGDIAGKSGQATAADSEEQGDVQITVKGQFVARQQ